MQNMLYMQSDDGWALWDRGSFTMALQSLVLRHWRVGGWRHDIASSQPIAATVADGDERRTVACCIVISLRNAQDGIKLVERWA